MSNAKSPYAFPEVRAVLDAALAAGGAIFAPRDPLGSHSEKAAQTFIARANNIRNNLRKIGESGPYERLRIARRGHEVLLELEPLIQPGDLRRPDGTPIEIDYATEPVLSDEDRQLLEELEKEIGR